MKTEDSHSHEGHEEAATEDGSHCNQGRVGTSDEQSDGWQTATRPVGQRRRR
jgi:hypothetical protein